MASFTEKTFDKCIQKVTDNEIFAILFVGKNFGLSIELSNKLIKHFNPEENVVLDYTNDTKENPFILELQSNLQDGFFSSKKAIKVYNLKSKKGISKTFEFFNSDIIKDKLIIFFGDEIDGRSELKNFFDKSEKTACISLYEDDEKTANEVVRGFFLSKNIKIQNEAIDKIANLLHGDRGILISECEKLILYCKDKSEIIIDDVLETISDRTESDLVSFVDNILSCNSLKTIKEFEKLTDESGNLILISRMVIRIATNILTMKHFVQNGENVDQIIKNNFIFYKRAPIVKKILLQTTIPTIENCIKNAMQVEKNSKIYGEKIAKQIFIKTILLSNIK